MRKRYEFFHSPATYRSEASGSSLVFKDGAFSWPERSWLGSYRFLHNDGSDYLELVYGYAREQTYKFIVLEMNAGKITGFRISDRNGQEEEFWKV
jgi:hypothetical protein